MDIEDVASQHQYWISREDDAIGRRRSAFATLLSMGEDEVHDLSNGDRWNAIRLRLIALLDALQTAGCFILRKGTIESYYQFADAAAADGKPSAAAEEVEHLEQQEKDDVERAYSDVLQALRYAASREDINEAEALRELLLSIAAPALAKIDVDTTKQELDSLAQRLAGDASKIISMSVSDEQGTPHSTSLSNPRSWT